MQNSDIIKNNSTFLFVDNAKDLNINQRSISFYEYAGMMKFTFKNENRFGEDFESFNYQGGFIFYQKFFNRLYNMGQYKMIEPQYEVIINKGDYALNNETVLRLLFSEYFIPEKFNKNIKRIIKLDYRKINT